MDDKDIMCIELVNPLSTAFNGNEMISEIEISTMPLEFKNVILTIPLHEDFYDWCHMYCRAYKDYIYKKVAQ